MNNSNPAARYAAGIPHGMHMSYTAPAGAPNPYQSMRGAYPIATAAFVAQQQQQLQQVQQQQLQLQQAQSMLQAQQVQQQQQQVHQTVMTAPVSAVHPQQVQQQQQVQVQQQQQQQVQQQRPRVAVDGPYGLLALPGLIQHSANPENSESAAFFYLTRGFDLNSLGINVAQQRPLHPTLVSLALERPEVPVIAEYRIPDCYKQAKPRQPTLKLLQKYKNDTLLYIFYSMPRDLLQVAAARVLLERGWCFHKVRQQWMRRRSSSGFEFFNQNTWKMEIEENYQPNPAEVESDLSDPAHASLSAVIAGSNNNNNNNNNNNTTGGSTVRGTGGDAAAAAATTPTTTTSPSAAATTTATAGTA
ncbi:CCR4-NOT transcription complex subunit 2 [Trypanosoma theileri]|uniref:CCR4-NOT transcription complex subunit 2 n=1 Tax=Trypanosoma theileri TaxID=67003 RepID=A0A1X0NMV3_9TRYP|nr:CCR4-NOT transcription complex subunit 2 [Trypanosoma theileri]ORC85828.1 CCR4-NOT transcription complex subunit 2 [Trypanosoma theileri]